MQVSFRTIQTSTGRKPVGGALRARAAVRPALRQGCAFLLGLAGGWAVLYGALMPFGLGLVLGLAEDCFAPCAAGAALGVLLHGFGALSLRSVCLLCALGAAGGAGLCALRHPGPGRRGHLGVHPHRLGHRRCCGLRAHGQILPHPAAGKGVSACPAAAFLHTNTAHPGTLDKSPRGVLYCLRVR